MTRIHTQNVSRGSHGRLASVRRLGNGAVATLVAGLFVLATTVSGVGALPDTAPPADVQADPALAAMAILDPADRADAFAALSEVDPGSAVSESSREAMLWSLKEAMLDSSDQPAQLPFGVR